MTIADLPAVNASLNFCAAVLLTSGWFAVRAGRRDIHARLMIAALIASAAFLVSYLVYHFNIVAVTKYQGQGFLRALYFFILFTHIPLAVLVVPGSLRAVWMAARGDFVRHRKTTRWLWPVWMYVSVTGVAIYVMLYILPANAS
ncbi:MAG: DUF420 domain-containing protein [Candidatus Hydrogenedentota bacterium]